MALEQQLRKAGGKYGRTMEGAAIWGGGDLGWKKLEERREEKILYGRRLEDGTLVKIFIAEKMKGCGNVNW